VDADPVAQLIVGFAKEKYWRGTATALLNALRRHSREVKLPPDAASLGMKLRRVAPALRLSGVEVEFDRASHQGIRMIGIRKIGKSRQRRQRRRERTHAGSR
jgi:hypothetical protein